MSKLHEIWKKQTDLEVERILTMTDAQVMAEAVQQYGSPEAVEKVCNKMRQSIRASLERFERSKI